MTERSDYIRFVGCMSPWRRIGLHSSCRHKTVGLFFLKENYLQSYITFNLRYIGVLKE